MKYISVLNVSRQLQENFRNFSPLKFPTLSLCRLSEIDYGTVKSDYLVLVLVKSILDYYLMSRSFSRSRDIKLFTIQIFLKEIWINQLPPSLFVRYKKRNSKQESIK